jgi:transposase
LKAAQQRRLLRVLLKGPLAHGYNTNVWTTARIAEVISSEFGVNYHRDHVGRLMHSLNWSHQNRRSARSNGMRQPSSNGSGKSGRE